MANGELATIKVPVLREVIKTSSPVAAMVVGRGKGFSLVIRFGRFKRTLVTVRGEVRLFASLNTAGAFVSGLGIPRFEVDMTEHQPGRLRKPRPDRAEALRRTRTRMQQQSLM